MELNIVIHGDAIESLKTLSDSFINSCICSPPYWQQRDYGDPLQIGLEPTVEEYLNNLFKVFDEVKRVLRDDGTCFVNLNDTYAGSGTQNNPEWKKCESAGTPDKKNVKYDVPHKCLCMIPQRFAWGMIQRGWTLRNVLTWHKTTAKPESVTDRFTQSDQEPIFFFVKSRKYYFEQQLEPFSTNDYRIPGVVRNRIYGYQGKYAVDDIDTESEYIPKQGRNKRSVWTINPEQSAYEHYAMYPKELVKNMMLAGCPEGGIVLDIFAGGGTTLIVAEILGRNFIGIEINQDYIDIYNKRRNGITKEIICTDTAEQMSLFGNERI